jgi:hypothetical protein
MGTALGPDTHSFIAPKFVARFDTQAVPGSSDRISFDPTGTASFQTEAANKPLTAGLIKEANGLLQSAELTTTSFHGATEELRFDQAASALIFQHSGAASSFRLQLTSRGKSTPAGVFGSAPQPIGAIFDSGMLQVSAGATITFSPTDWDRLDAVAMTVRDPQGHEVRQTLQNQAQTTPLGEITAVSVLQRSTLPNVQQLTARAQIDQIAANAQVTLSWIVSDASGKIVGHNIQALAAADLTRGEHTYSWSFSTTDPGAYTARASLSVLEPWPPLGTPSQSNSDKAPCSLWLQSFPEL